MKWTNITIIELYEGPVLLLMTRLTTYGIFQSGKHGVHGVLLVCLALPERTSQAFPFSFMECKLSNITDDRSCYLCYTRSGITASNRTPHSSRTGLLSLPGLLSLQ